MKKSTRTLLIILLSAVVLFALVNLLSSDGTTPAEAIQPQLAQSLDLQQAGSADAQPEEEGLDLPLLEEDGQEEQAAESASIDEDGVYTSKEDVALYLHTYGRLPGNFITKAQARDLGWSGGGLDGYADGMCIGGDRFGNNEGLLPEKKGRQYRECDIGTLHKSSRGAKRIVFSNDGLIYYTGDHYESYTLLYGEE